MWDVLFSPWKSLFGGQTTRCNPSTTFTILSKNTIHVSSFLSAQGFLAIFKSLNSVFSIGSSWIIVFCLLDTFSQGFILVEDHSHICVEHHLLLVFRCRSINSLPLVSVLSSTNMELRSPTCKKKISIIAIIEDSLICWVGPGSFIP